MYNLKIRYFGKASKGKNLRQGHIGLEYKGDTRERSIGLAL